MVLESSVFVEGPSNVVVVVDVGVHLGQGPLGNNFSEFSGKFAQFIWIISLLMQVNSVFQGRFRLQFLILLDSS